MERFSFLFNKSYSSKNNPIVFFERLIENEYSIEDFFREKINEDPFHFFDDIHLIKYKREEILFLNPGSTFKEIETFDIYKEKISEPTVINKNFYGVQKLASKFIISGELSCEQYGSLLIEYETNSSIKLIEEEIYDTKKDTNKIQYLRILIKKIENNQSKLKHENNYTEIIKDALNKISKHCCECIDIIMPPEVYNKKEITKDDIYNDLFYSADSETISNNKSISAFNIIKGTNKLNIGEIRDLHEYLKEKNYIDSPYKPFKKAVTGKNINPEERINWIKSKSSLVEFINFLHEKGFIRKLDWKEINNVFMFNGMELENRFYNNRPSKSKDLIKNITGIISFK